MSTNLDSRYPLGGTLCGKVAAGLLNLTSVEVKMKRDQQATCMRPCRLIGADGHALLVVAGGLVVGVDDGVGGDTVGVVGLGPRVDGVDVVGSALGADEEGEHFSAEGATRRA